MVLKNLFGEQQKKMYTAACVDSGWERRLAGLVGNRKQDSGRHVMVVVGESAVGQQDRVKCTL